MILKHQHQIREVQLKSNARQYFKFTAKLHPINHLIEINIYLPNNVNSQTLTNHTRLFPTYQINCHQ